ncbi:MAG TPA: FkbM family methyltransferase [Phycisphaerae bacterium]|nr:FkbM family methyltransferase [Phycisphaerae bacterium]
MSDYPSEPAMLRLSRKAAAILPKGRSMFVRNIARFTGHRKPFLAPVGSHQFLIDLDERVSRTLYLYGTFEETITDLLPKLIEPGDLVVDAGANFGYFTILAAAATGPTGKVFAVEPDPRNIERLLTVLRANHAMNVTHVREGFFDRAGTVTFHLSTNAEDNLGSSSIIQHGEGRATMEIPVTTLDQFAAEQGIEKIDLLKMDIEGAEPEALAGARDLIAGRRIRKLLLEMHLLVLGPEKAKALADRFLDAGYHCYFIRENLPAHSRPAHEYLAPLASIPWLQDSNPHCLFTAEPIPGV